MARHILRDHALENIWAESIQDTQYRIQPARVSPPMGVHRYGRVYWTDIALPFANDKTSNKSFHLYPLGQLDPTIFSFKLERNTWYTLDQISISWNVLVEVTLVTGGCVPGNICSLMHTMEGYLILAVERTTTDFGTKPKMNVYDEMEDTRITIDDTELSIRFYHNAILHSLEWSRKHTIPSIVSFHRQLINNADDFNKFKEKVRKVLIKYGSVGLGTYYLDGFVVDKPTAYRDEFKGKEFCLYYDQTARERIFFRINALKTYRSKVDVYMDKYLLVSPNQTDDRIDFCDDIDFYLVSRNPVNGYKGVRLDGMHFNTVRQVTHRGWGIRTDIVEQLVLDNNFLGSLDNLEIVAMVRDGGMRHKLGYQANRIEDLYRLPYIDQLNSMAEVQSNLDIWKASNLEASAYNKVMTVRGEHVTDELVEEAYGYNAATKAVMKSFYKVEANKIFIDQGHCIPFSEKVPNGSRTETHRCVFWYNKYGKLIGWNQDNSIRDWISVPFDLKWEAVYGEVLLGRLEQDNGYIGNHRDLAQYHDPYWGYYGHRHYCCTIVGGGIDNKWFDVTGSAFVEEVPAVGNVPPGFRWNHKLLSQAGLYPMTRYNNTIGVQSFQRHAGNIDGPIQLTLSEFSQGKVTSVGVAPGHVDVFMDGSPLIADLDYHYSQHTSTVYVIKKADTPTVNIIVRLHGLANPETNKPFYSTDIGFVKNGMLSANMRYDTRNDRDTRIIIAGTLYPSDKVKYDEMSITEKANYEGMPYAVEDYHPNVEHFTSMKTIDALMESRKIDKDVSDFLSPRLSTPTDGKEFVQGTRWQLSSPVMARFIQLMLNGTLSDSLVEAWEIEGTTAKNIGIIAKDYIDYDPTNYRRDHEYLRVDPYPLLIDIKVTARQYRLLQEVNMLMLHDIVNLSPFISVT